MGVVTILCPRTGQSVSTGLEMSKAEFAALPFSRHMVMDCWMCGQEHEWSRRWATFVATATEAADRRRAFAD